MNYTINDLKQQVNNIQNIVNYMYLNENKVLYDKKEKEEISYIDEVYTVWQRSDGSRYTKVTKYPPELRLWSYDKYSFYNLDTYKGYVNDYGHKIVYCYKQQRMKLFDD